MNPLYLLFALQAADIATTVIALRGRAIESNPILKKLMDAIGVLPALLLMKGAMVGLFWYYQDLLPAKLLWALCALYVGVVLYNLNTIKKGNS